MSYKIVKSVGLHSLEIGVPEENGVGNHSYYPLPLGQHVFVFTRPTDKLCGSHL